MPLNSTRQTQSETGLHICLLYLLSDQAQCCGKPHHPRQFCVSTELPAVCLMQAVCLQGMQHLTKLIFERAQPKRLGSQIITGPMLATLASEYVRAINEGAVPTISTAWQVSTLLRLLPFAPPEL